MTCNPVCIFVILFILVTCCKVMGSALCRRMMPSVKTVNHTYAALNINATVSGPATMSYHSRLLPTSAPTPSVDYPLLDYENMQFDFQTSPV
ncbi:hypothetical protein FKM82_018621 [Ascaphus truei]